MISTDSVLSLILSVPLISSIYIYVNKVLPYQENRQDLQTIQDPLHKYFPRIDTSWPITIVEHTCHALYLYELLVSRTHIDVPYAMLSFIMFIWTRSLMLYLLPLKVSDEMILLRDPIQRVFLNNTVRKDQPLFVQDLFFSGHVSFCVMMGMTCNVYAYTFYGSALFIFVCMMCSRIHYTIDMVVAPFIVYSFCHFSEFLLNTFVRRNVYQELIHFHT